MKYQVTVQGKVYEVDVEEVAPSKFLVEVNGKKAVIELEEEIKERKEELTVTEVIRAEKKAEVKVEAVGKEIKAEMSGTVVRVLVNEGDEVEAGQAVLILEAMKMENELPAPVSGRVVKVAVSEGGKVAAGQLLLVIEPSASGSSGSSGSSGNKNNPDNPKNPENGKEVKVEMAGTVVRILKKAGESVKAGEPIIVLEAMKMENEIVSPADGVVELLIEEGDKVGAGQVIAYVR
jgi:biotin carboxyl carrier protein